MLSFQMKDNDVIYFRGWATLFKKIDFFLL